MTSRMLRGHPVLAGHVSRIAEATGASPDAVIRVLLCEALALTNIDPTHVVTPVQMAAEDTRDKANGARESVYTRVRWSR